MLRDGYSFLRLVEAKLRIVTDRPLNEVPEAAEDREKLARRLDFDAEAAFSDTLRQTTTRIRDVFRRLV